MNIEDFHLKKFSWENTDFWDGSEQGQAISFIKHKEAVGLFNFHDDSGSSEGLAKLRILYLIVKGRRRKCI